MLFPAYGTTSTALPSVELVPNTVSGGLIIVLAKIIINNYVIWFFHDLVRRCIYSRNRLQVSGTWTHVWSNR